MADEDQDFGEGIGISDETLYAGMPTEPAVEAPGLSAEDLLPSEGGEDEDEPASAAGGKAKPAAAPAAAGREAEPGKKPEGEGAAKPTGEEEPPRPAITSLWDKQRQARDQEAANKRKELEATVSTQQATIDALQAQLATRSTETTTDKKADKQAGTDSDALKEFEKKFSALGPDSDQEEMAEAFKLAPAALAAATRAGAREATEALQEKYEALEAKLASQDQEREQTAKERAQEEVNRQFSEGLDTLDEEYGSHLRADADTQVAEWLAKRGYSDEEGKRPPLDLMLSRYEIAYKELAKEHPKTRTTEPPKGKPPRPDTGEGGSTVTVPKSGSMDEVLDAMYRAGEFKP